MGAQRLTESVAYLHQSVRLASQIGDNRAMGRALLNLALVLTLTDPVAGAEVARSAVGCVRQTGARDTLAVAIINLTQALLELGDWDAADQECVHADSYGLTEHDILVAQMSWQAALRGDATTAETLLAELVHMHASEDPQEKANISTVEAFIAAARRQARDALHHARRTLVHADTLGISFDYLRWAWPLAARAAHELRDTAALTELLAMVDAHPPGSLSPMLRAERDLVRARLAVGDGDPHAAAAFGAAVSSLRELSTPYHLAHGLLDHAEYLTSQGDVGAVALAVDEARAIGQRLRCQPLLDRSDAVRSAKLGTRV
jgi:hypothetical protein